MTIYLGVNAVETNARTVVRLFPVLLNEQIATDKIS